MSSGSHVFDHSRTHRHRLWLLFGVCVCGSVVVDVAACFAVPLFFLLFTMCSTDIFLTIPFPASSVCLCLAFHFCLPHITCSSYPYIYIYTPPATTVLQTLSQFCVVICYAATLRSGFLQIFGSGAFFFGVVITIIHT
jgi:hypothetical protein